MRILAGKYARKQLFLPDEKVTRPTSGKVKEALFNVLSNYLSLEGAIALDAFAGSGALGLEALSRGAIKAYFFEQNPKVFEIMKKNICHIGTEDYSIALRWDATKARAAPEACDVVFIDPPYGKGLVEQSLMSLIENKWITLTTYCVIEYGARDSLNLSNFEVLSEKKYGDTRLIIGKAKI